jgi:hypothetical protein
VAPFEEAGERVALHGAVEVVVGGPGADPPARSLRRVAVVGHHHSPTAVAVVDGEQRHPEVVASTLEIADDIAGHRRHRSSAGPQRGDVEAHHRPRLAGPSAA